MLIQAVTINAAHVAVSRLCSADQRYLLNPVAVDNEVSLWHCRLLYYHSLPGSTNAFVWVFIIVRCLFRRVTRDASRPRALRIGLGGPLLYGRSPGTTIAHRSAAEYVSHSVSSLPHDVTTRILHFTTFSPSWSTF